MRPSSCFWLFFCIIVGLCACNGGGQTPAPAPDCNSALINLLPCLDYVQGNVSAPPQNCCVGLGSVVQSNANCLCLLFNSSALPIQVNTTRALQLPALCSVATPNPSVCGVSAGAPVQQPAPTPPASTPVPPTTAPTTPSTTPPPTGTSPTTAATAPQSAATPPTAAATPPQGAGTPPTAAATPRSAGTPPTAATTPSSTTPVLAPSSPPPTPKTPSVTPSVAPMVAPSVAPVVSPSATSPGPASGVPALTPMVATPVPSPMESRPVSSPTSGPAMTPTVSVSSPPAPPPANAPNYAAPIATFSLLSVVIMVSSVLFLQL